MTRTRLVIAGLILTLACGAPSVDASARQPGHGDRVTVVLTSDRQFNSAVSWYDSRNKLRSQGDVALVRYDHETHLWAGSIVYTSRVRHQKVDTLFQSNGRFARCAVWVNAKKIREKTARAPRFATAYCR
ncbi:hypothetical protein GTV32_07710 [Gordonia sp. SID5947]|uniref:hypothetical protein n=1 Tax=Gordonia sp. SID5947 TaxID=2690315 RepID=UPI001369C7C9|nr:hypothetical protein [Gordonia sp. SID5947]MYR06206.1 hypothetical protein [Gordonia sp. SID5947]